MVGYKEELSDLKWFHDCIVQAISFGWIPVTSLRITVACPHDLGRPDWDGRTVAIIADNIALLDYEMRMSSDGDSIDAIRAGTYSKNLESAIARSMKSGWQPSPRALTICFSSGSSIQLLCDATRVEVL
jgi:hypothetical protein